MTWKKTPDSSALVPEVDIDELWGHQPDEPHEWYTRFYHFLMEGPTRTVAAAVKSYGEIYDDEPMHFVTWHRMVAKWDWWKRAYAYDRAQQGKEEEAVAQHRITERIKRYRVMTRLADIINTGFDQIEERMLDDDDPLYLSMAQINRAIATYLSHSKDEFEPKTPAIKIEDHRTQAFTMIEVQKEYDDGEIIDGTAGLIDG